MRVMGRGARKIHRQYIGAWLKRRGISQRELADQLGVRESFISDVVRGKKTPSLASAVKIAQILNTTVEALLRPPPK